MSLFKVHDRVKRALSFQVANRVQIVHSSQPLFETDEPHWSRNTTIAEKADDSVDLVGREVELCASQAWEATVPSNVAVRFTATTRKLHEGFS